MRKKIIVNPSTLQAIRRSGIPEAMLDRQMARARGMNMDSADSASIWYGRELEFVEARAYEIKFPELSALRLFPVSTEVNAGAETVTYRSFGYVGAAHITANYGEDIPRADIINRESTSFIRGLTNYYGYSVQEARNARYAGMPLEAQKAESARKMIDIGINNIAWAGDKDHQVYGVLSSELQVPVYTLSPGISSASTWLSKTPDEILNDILAMRAAVIFNSNGVESPDTLAVPQSVLTYLARPFTVGGIAVSESIHTYLTQKLGWLKEIVGVHELESNAYDTNCFSTPDAPMNVAFLYSKDAGKFKIEIPLPFNQLPPQFVNLETKIICEARTAGVLMYYPTSALIVLGI
jgi:hypothetical protein